MFQKVLVSPRETTPLGQMEEIRPHSLGELADWLELIPMSIVEVGTNLILS